MKSHSRYLSRDLLDSKNLIIDHLEDDQNLQDAVLSAFHIVNLTLSATGVVRMVENHLGHAFVKTVAMPMLAIGPGFPSGIPQFMQPPPQPPTQPQSP